MKRDKNGGFVFAEFKDFRPNMSPYKIFSSGAFGGTYWRPIRSGVTGKRYSGEHRKYKHLSKLGDGVLCAPNYDKTVNKYGVKVGMSLEYWEEKKWISSYDPYGWVQWYCNFFGGRRCPDDERQIKRWLGLAGPNGRFRRNLVNQIAANAGPNANADANAEVVSPKIRQTLLHWGFELT